MEINMVLSFVGVGGVCLVVGFVIGALVMRNNRKAFDAVMDKIKEQVDTTIKNVEKERNVLDVKLGKIKLELEDLDDATRAKLKKIVKIVEE